MSLPSRVPGIVRSYDRDARLCRVEIPGFTDGADVLPEAEFEYPIGDKSEHTEIRILPGDRVWLVFRNGDPRYPIITGYRPKQVANDTLWRRFHHENIQLEADEGDLEALASQDIKVFAERDVVIDAGRKALLTAETEMSLTVGASNIKLTPAQIIITTPTETHTVPLATFSALVQIAGLLSANGGLAAVPGAGGGPAASIGGDVTMTSGNLTVDTGNITATAGEVQAGSVTLTGHDHSNPEGGRVGPAEG